MADIRYKGACHHVKRNQIFSNLYLLKEPMMVAGRPYASLEHAYKYIKASKPNKDSDVSRLWNFHCSK